MTSSAARSIARRSGAGASAVSAVTRMCRPVDSTQAVAIGTAQIRHSWLSSAAQMVGWVKK